MSNVERIDELAALTQNWDSYGAKPILPLTANTARKLAEAFDTKLDIAVTPTGLIIFSWLDETVEIVVSEDTVKIYLSD